MFAVMLAVVLSGQIDKQAEYRKQSEQQRSTEISATERNIAFYQSVAADRRKPAQARKNAQDRVKQLKADLKVLQDKRQPFVLRLYMNALRSGAFGVPRYPDNVVGDERRTVVADVRQVIDGANMIVEAFGIVLWIKGKSTADITTGVSIPLSDCFECTGTKTYTTAIGGTKTVFVLEPFAPSP